MAKTTTRVNTRRDNVYRDFDLTFAPSPITGDVSTIVDETAIRQSIRNILFTRPGERGFVPEFGSPLGNILFENFNPMTLVILRHAIQDALAYWEPRIEVQSVDMVYQETVPAGIQVSVTFAIKAQNNRLSSVKFFLKRIR